MGRAARQKRERKEFRQAVETNLADLLPPMVPRKVVREDSSSKLSAALLELGKPFMSDDMPLALRKTVMRLVALGWNMSITGNTELPETLKQGMGEQDLESPNGGELESFLALVREAKSIHFPHDRRLVLDLDLTESRREFHVYVVGSVPIKPGESGV